MAVESAKHAAVGMEKVLRLAREDDRFPRVHLIEPSKSGYILIVAEVDQRPWLLFPMSRSKRDLLRRTKAKCALLLQSQGVLSAVCFRALLAAPGGHGGYLARRRTPVNQARFDVAILIETESPEMIGMIRKEPVFIELENDIYSAARYAEIVGARNVKRMGNVDHTTNGVFLFNFFVADDTEQNLEVWEYTAGWFEQETSLNNSTLLLPLSASGTKYSSINHCRWDHLWDVLPSLVFKRSFRRYVLAHFDVNNTAPMPALYRLS